MELHAQCARGHRAGDTARGRFRAEGSEWSGRLAAVGRPVSVTDEGGTTEIIPGGEHGFVAAAAAEACLDDALERAWQRRHDLPAMGAAAAEHIRACLPSDPCRTFADRLEGIYAAVAARR